MKATRAAAAAAVGLLACSICCCNGLLGLLQVTALSHSSIPQFQAWLHPLSPLSPPPPPLFLHNHLPFPLNLHSSSKLLPFRKDPTVPSAAWLGAKHLCGSGWPTLPGSQVAVGPPPRSALSVSHPCQSASPTGPRQWGTRVGPVRDPDWPATHPDWIRYSNLARQVHFNVFTSEPIIFSPILCSRSVSVIGI